MALDTIAELGARNVHDHARDAAASRSSARSGRCAATGPSRRTLEPVSVVGAGDVAARPWSSPRVLDGRPRRGGAARSPSRRARRRSLEVGAAASTRARPAGSLPRVEVDELQPVADRAAAGRSLSVLAPLLTGRRRATRASQASSSRRVRSATCVLRGEVRARRASPSTTSCSSRPSRPCSRTTSSPRPADADDRARDPDRLRRDGHRHRGAAGDRARARGRHRRHPPQPLDRGPGRRGRQGQALRGGDDRRAGDALARTRSSRDALELMARYRISGVPITDDDGASSASSRTATSASASRSTQPRRRR